jgi:site-specific DNA-methyltransferase (cytosine-N4-specific)
MATTLPELCHAESGSNPFRGRPPFCVAYKTKMGRMLHGLSDELLQTEALERYRGTVDLVFTSPPFPLNRKKRYGNLNGDEYIKWLSGYGPLLKKMLKPGGSIVMEVGNSWEQGSPVMSTLPIRSLLKFQEDNDLYLCQEFVWQNPAKLPSPAQWVNVERIRLKDSFTKIWWLSQTPKPKADNRRVLKEYSFAMKELLRTGSYNSGKRPSEHNIGEKSFNKDNGGAIPGSVLTYANTHATDPYQQYCRDNEIELHPARMPLELADFFVRLLTEPGDLVLDPFGGTNTTGAAAEALGRYWISIEAEEKYILGSLGRFQDSLLD